MRGFARKIKTVVKRVLMRHDNRSAAHSLPPSSVVLQGFDNSLNLSNCQEASIGSVTRSATECFTEVNVTTSHGYMNVAGQGYVASQGNGANITCQGSDTGQGGVSGQGGGTGQGNGVGLGGVTVPVGAIGQGSSSSSVLNSSRGSDSSDMPRSPEPPDLPVLSVPLSFTRARSEPRPSEVDRGQDLRLPAVVTKPTWVSRRECIARRLHASDELEGVWRPKSVYHSELVEGLSLIEDFISKDEERRIIDHVEMAGWDETAIMRQTRQYGFKFDHLKREVTPANQAIPEAYLFITDRLKEITDVTFQQLIINKYTPTQGIGPHTDDFAFGPVVVSNSLGEKCVIDFSKDEGLNRVRSYTLFPGSLFIMEGAARKRWRHGIGFQANQIDGSSPLFTRTSPRWSLTFRTVTML